MGTYGIQKKTFFALLAEPFAFVKHLLGRIGGDCTSRLITSIVGAGGRFQFRDKTFDLMLDGFVELRLVAADILQVVVG